MKRELIENVKVVPYASGTVIDRDGFLSGIFAASIGSITGTPTAAKLKIAVTESDTSGGTYAIAGAVERMYQHLSQHCGAEPACIMAGGAGWKMAPSMTRPFQLLDNLIFDGLLVMAQRRWG